MGNENRLVTPAHQLNTTTLTRLRDPCRFLSYPKGPIMTAHNTDRQQLHPLFGPNKLKLGVFGYNGPGVVHTTHPDKKYHSWREARALSQLIDNAGLEAIVPYSRWRGFGTGNHI